MPKNTRLVLFSFFLSCATQAQVGLFRETPPSLFHGSLEAQGIVTGKNTVPFWMRSDQWGSVPLPGASGALIASGWKDYDSTTTNFFDWGGGIELRGDAGADSSRLRLIQGYVKVRASIFELKVGRFKEFMGLVDSSLSSGAFSVSDNALPIPKIEGSIPEFYTIPIFGGLFAFKGNIAHGWLGKIPVTPSKNVPTASSYFHQTSLYGRLGKPGWRLHLYAGLNHQVYWGNEREIYGPGWGLSNLQTFKYVLLGKTWKGSKVGNHLGSVDLGLQYEFPTVRLFVYRQSFYDEGALAKLANIADGLNGISLTNKQDDIQVPDYFPVQGNDNSGWFHWHKVVLELFYSVNQAGYPWSRRTKSGDENYYNSNSYPEGWSYDGAGLGNPFITPAYTTRAGFPNVNFNYFNNNRVTALYAALQGSLFHDYRFTARGSYTLNYGTFGTSIWGYSTGNHFVRPQFGIWKKVNQASGWFSIERDLDPGWTVGCVIAVDRGDLFYSGGGFILRLKKSL